jgi:betaine-aldehyde dehydrogenase
MNQGEVCSATSRLYVHESVYDSFLEELLRITRGIKIGDPLDEATEMGPVISKRHLERVLRYIDLGKKEGAEILCGGFRLMDERFKRGFFLSPTIFVGCRNDMAIVQEEIFGPVLVVFKFKDEDEAVELANATRYGLGAAVFTRDVGRVYRVVEKLRAGVVWVNSSQLCFVQLPWGGYKQSGIGRELGTYAVEEYTQLKQVVINVGYGTV